MSNNPESRSTLSAGLLAGLNPLYGLVVGTPAAALKRLGEKNVLRAAKVLGESPSQELAEANGWLVAQSPFLKAATNKDGKK